MVMLRIGFNQRGFSPDFFFVFPSIWHKGIGEHPVVGGVGWGGASALIVIKWHTVALFPVEVQLLWFSSFLFFLLIGGARLRKL